MWTKLSRDESRSRITPVPPLVDFGSSSPDSSRISKSVAIDCNLLQQSLPNPPLLSDSLSVLDLLDAHLPFDQLVDVAM